MPVVKSPSKRLGDCPDFRTLVYHQDRENLDTVQANVCLHPDT